MNKSLIIVSILSYLGFTQAFAQGTLSKEITIDTDYEPQEVTATRLNNSAELAQLKAESSSALRFSNTSYPTALGNEVYVLPPYGFQTASPYRKNRGYIDFCMGAQMTIVGSAGYKILDTHRNYLEAWFQHDSYWNASNKNGFGVDLSYFKQKMTNEVVGINYKHTFSPDLQFSANGKYHFGRQNYLDFSDINFGNVNEGNINLAVKGKTPSLDYNIALDYDHFGYSLTQGAWKDEYKPLRENHLSLNADGKINWGEHSDVGLKFTGEYYNNFYTDKRDYSAREFRNSMGKLRFTPFYHCKTKRMLLHLGVNIDLSINDGTVFNISPDVKFDLMLHKYVWFYASLNGGRKVNTLSELYSQEQRMNPFSPIRSSYTPFDLFGGFKIGTFKGFSVDVYGGFLHTDNAPLPVTCVYDAEGIFTEQGRLQYQPIDYTQVRVGGILAYSYNDIVKASVQIEGTRKALIDKEETIIPEGKSKWEFHTKVAVDVKPIKPLTVGISFEYASNRQAWSKLMYQDVYYRTNPRNIYDLCLHARYEITDNFGIFLYANNLLNKRWAVNGNYSNHALGVLGGFTFKF